MTLKNAIKNAKAAALRDGYDQVVIEDRTDGSFSICRSYHGCCPEWHGKIVAVIWLDYGSGAPVAKAVV